VSRVVKSLLRNAVSIIVRELSIACTSSDRERGGQEGFKKRGRRGEKEKERKKKKENARNSRIFVIAEIGNKSC